MDIFFDFDGTLYNTYPKMTQAFAEAAEKFNIKINEKALYQSMRATTFGATIHDFAEEQGLDLVKFRSVYAQIESSTILESQAFNGVEEILEKVKDMGGRNYLLTHRDAVSTELLKRDNLWQYFTDEVNSSMDFPRKPDPTSLNYLMEKYNSNKKTAWMVGDRNLDIEAAHNANIKGLLFDYDEIIDPWSNPELTIDSFIDVNQILN